MSDTVKYSNYINGEWIESSSGEVGESLNPAKAKEVVGRFQKSTAEDLDSAVQAASKAQKLWRKETGAARGALLYIAADILESRIEEVAETMTKEMGKTLPEAKGETARGVAILRYYAGEGLRKTGDVIPSTDPGAFMFTTRKALGVVGVITPWNFPVAIPIWKMAPALIYGNAVVLKPASEASITAAKVIECFVEAGFPKGIVNYITGSGSVIGQGLADHKLVDGVTFTGSDGVGQQVGQAVLARGGKYQLEMGGKNPVIVADDADLDLAVEATISGGLKSTGQKCTATSRVIVDQAIYETFKEKLVAKVSEIKVGDGLDTDSWMGPSVSASQLDTVLSYIEKGKEEGAKLIFGGKRLEENGLSDGYYVEPAIFDEVDTKMSIAQEEIFGPVLALIKVNGLEEAINVANDSKFGLSASIFTTNIARMLTFIEDMDAGLVRVNAESAGVELQAPFGGMKQSSSHSREQGTAAIEFFTEVKTVFIKG
ncbi:alpha-ketoglutaric semialdehyde dehydrogenase GucD [Alkalicoccobacillus porphyridii]|uniref:Aldehyde dehydrogenase family protein n=1 Tax=Alkalicoccobacillus porphyridii TaxID=2597270 RepID=A0A554A438_9BACI|nr:alpha-ketoglutaric semialdehyde dehydrogenase GucD [Alkalicoccobacillus porphyridii]TSB48460.1 aldehyde dehydrogenase family protein [Alkalicoccobacillus porphyridii]